ncbi:heavy metal translocating P-type ATPase [Pseudobacter ginsenosidimutans]|uniref:P-type Zn(2+) transporter n=1 Tax=Pseudobacter ginsenosidimutans TaxID=661488 RepID=A0A4Q7MUX2_9BACT|nr:heavy metal translocating P-type ATPase [Pseudobacter ginsenosidimutans]QEC40579.1 heavy metal translocating P-type ATPase [Pseudobacter ginsenosidimutans]RZS72705.1 Cd2+/Zn2+-exporting ATPase [Pseudobacter ginsenosidimutans]
MIEEKKEQHEEHAHEHGGIFGRRSDLIFSLTGGVLLGIGYLLEKFEAGPAWLSLACFIAVYFFGGYYTLKEAILSVRRGVFEVDFLMLVAAAGAASLGKWPEGALLLFLFSLGHALEALSMDKARKSIEALAGLAPTTATVRREGVMQDVPVSSLKAGDIVIIRPNSKIPADGYVTQGSSTVNQAPITGESIPVDKLPLPAAMQKEDDKKIGAQYKVFAGTINGAGSLEIRVTKEAKDSTLARVMQMVKEAEQQQSPTQQFTKKIERYYVPAVLILVVLLMFAYLVIDETFSQSFYRSMAVLVAASPCALAISTPSAVLSGVARAARQGVLVKGGRPLEELGMLTALAFDKTGTLTEGRPKLNAIVPLEGITETELLRMSVAVEKLSDHPLAAAIVNGGMEKLGVINIPEATDMKAVAGKGVQATWEGESILIGNDELFKTAGLPALPDAIAQQVMALQQAGNTSMIIRKGDRFAGILGVMDLPRAEAPVVISELRKLGIRKMVMLTGDNQRVADAVAAKVGIDIAKGDLLPEEKVANIEQLRREENKLAMVGDGVNDAPAMARSTVGIAMGAAGSDVALEAADIALMADNLSNLPFAIGLSRAGKRIIRQNLILSLGMVAILIPLAITGVANIGPAVAFHEGSTLLVVLNALRLLGYEQ